MIFIEKMKNMKIYKTATFLPTLAGNKKKNSAITLLTPNYASSKKLLNHPLFVNKLRFNSYYLERDISYYINDNNLEEAVYDEEYSVYQLLTEISSEKRNSLKDSDFGIPSKRKFPLDTEKRVRSAIKFFNYVDKEDEDELASNIKKAMKKFDITDIKVGEKNRFKNYYNESVALTESLLKNEKDILYNKDKFESGEINLCFVTGHSGSGKSTLAHKKEKEKDVDAIELDDLLSIKDDFTMKQLKEYSDLIYSYFNGPGKKFYVGESDLRVTPENQYEDILFRDFVHYAMKYSKSHKDKKYIIEGIWIFEIDSKNKPYFEPNEFNDYAFYIKGTSMIISKYRAAKRNSWDSDTPKRTSLKNFVTKNWKWYRFNEKQLKKFKNYFKKKPETILESKEEPLDNEESLEKSDVLFLSNITPENIVKAYKHLGVSLPDKVACKVHSGEDGNQNYLRPELWSDLINYVNGTVVECNTAYEGARNTTEKHKELIKKHGWNQFDVDIMDEDFDFELPIEKYNIINKNYVGSHMRNYSSMIVLSHFKGHPMGGFGGALKQLSIGCASSRGKKYIHGFGNADRGDQILSDFKGEPTDTNEQLNFINAMADAASSVHNFFKDNIVYINIMSNMSVDCDCVAHAEDHCMKDIGILISKDPVAIDKACVDLVYNSNDPGKKHLIEKIESRGALNIFNACKNIDFGNTEYNLINLDAEESNDVSNEYANPDNIFSLIESNNSKNIIFDLGGVLLEDQDWRVLLKQAYSDLKDQEIETFVKTYQDFLNKSDTASFNDARVAYMSAFDDSSMRSKAIRAFNVLVDTVKPYSYTVDLLKELQRKGYKLYYLSNWSNYGFNAMKAHGKLDFLKYFNDGVVSYEVGFMKPDVEIFNLFLKKMNLKAEECIFFDDKYDNCRGAKASGMNAYIWRLNDNSLNESIDIKNFPLKSKYFDKKDNAYNIDKFISGERNILYVTGLSGSGKSTLSMDLADKYKAEYIELDFVMLYFMKKYKEKGKQMKAYNNMKSNCPDACKFLNKTNEMKYSGLIDWKSIQIMAQVTRDFVSWFEANYSGNGKKYIICGSFIFEFIPYDFFIDRPIIIKQNNIYKTLYRRTMREINTKDYANFKDWVKGIKKHIKMSQNLSYKASSKSVGVFSDKISNSITESKDKSDLDKDFKKTDKKFKLLDINSKQALKYVDSKFQLDNKSGRLAICVNDDEAAGFIYWNKSGTISPLKVYEKYRGYGISKLLLKEAIDNGGKELGVYKDNKVAINLYKKFGFKEIRRKKYKDGDDVIIMSL